ncbi:hypothetical protein V6Z12_A10G150000 [Gossypium hirsutum]
MDLGFISCIERLLHTFKLSQIQVQFLFLLVV